MTDGNKSVPGHMFERKYRQAHDPWGFETSDYELEKYRATLDALPRSRYRSALEIGCSIGVFTEMLAPRCGRLLATDVSPTAIDRARTRFRANSSVTFRVMSVPEEFPDGQFDLIVLSEVGYYWSEPDLLRARDLMIRHLEPAGHVVLVHWTPEIDDAPLTGDIVHTRFSESCTLAHITGSRHPTYRLDVFEKREP